MYFSKTSDQIPSVNFLMLDDIVGSLPLKYLPDVHLKQRFLIEVKTI